VLWLAGPWLPLILLMETGQILVDFVVLRAILGSDWRAIPLRVRIRVCAVAYSMMILLPAGRAAGDVTRGALLAKYVGAARAAAAGAQLWASYIFANAFISAADCVIVGFSLGWRSPLALLLAGNTVLMLLISGALLAMLWDGRLGRWIERVRQRFVSSPREARTGLPSHSTPAWRGIAVCSIVRLIQVAQYGVIVCAVGGAIGVRSAFLVHGVHLVAATVGDMVPNQLGVVDGAYRAFAGVIGFAATPERALSIAFVERIAQLTLALVCLVVAVVTAARVDDGRVPGGRPRTSSASARGVTRSWPARGRTAERSFRRSRP
jgi:dUTPase